jgi:hypothetical protein
VLGQCVLHPPEHQVEPAAQVEGLEQLDLALDRQVGPPAHQVGQRRGVVDAAQHLGQPAAAQRLEQGAQRSPQLGGPGGDVVVDGAVVDRRGVDPQPAGLADDPEAHLGPDSRPDDQRRHAAGQVAPVLDAGDRAHPGVAALGAPGDEQQGAPGLGGGVGGGPRLVGLEGEGHDHPGQHDVVGERQDRQGHGVEIGHRGPLREST